VNANDERAGDPGADSGQRAPLFTIGYGARTLEEFVTILQTNRIEFLIDVRSSPYSKFRPEFSKEPLQARLERAGIRYLFMGDALGGQPRDPACYTDGKADYDKIRAQTSFQSGVERLRNACAQQCRVAIMCSEGRPEQCHRSKLIGEALAATRLPVTHIDEDGALLSQQQVIDRLTGGQQDLFGAPAFTSRKRYAPRSGEGGDHPPL
jgi:uncharacterized protein (DUF488 family)